ncbi:MAG: Bug family tripartite tricarboxylate transporter substrate binding protein [Zwartia sp.]
MMQCIKLMTASQARLGLCTASLQQWAIRLVLAIVGSSSLAPQLLLAQTVAKFPDKSIRFVVPFPPGGGNDILARAIAPRLAEAFGQMVVVDNRAGAGGNIGSEFVAKSAPDGYTILMASNQITINPWLDNNVPFDIEKDFVAVAQVASVPMVLVVNPAVPANDLKSFIALVKADPSKFNHSTPGTGTAQHIAFEVFNYSAGVKVTHVPYKGTGPAIADLIGGQVQSAIGTMASLEQHVKAGKLRALGLTTAVRSAAMPDVPTIAEAAGLPGFEVPLWYSILAPANTPKDIVEKLSAEIGRALADRATNERLTGQGFIVTYLNPQQMDEMIKKDLLYWQKTIKAIGLKIDK